MQLCAVGAGAAATAGSVDGGGGPARVLQSDGEATVEQLQAQLERLREQRRERLSTMAAVTKADARRVGIQARPGVVVLSTSGSLATGWAVGPGRILTVGHATSSVGQRVSCWSLAGESFQATVRAREADFRPDVALLETDHPLVPIPTGSSRDVQDGDPLVQVGHAGNFGYWVLAAGPYRGQWTESEYACDVPILIGNSGSPVLDLEGRVVGIAASATLSPEQRAAWGEPVRDERVHYEPIRPNITSYHVPIESALNRLEAWS